ncbi:unnamed protein product [Adineta steineri]|uniref:protein-tyrosine-phosphatase n=3 Tax=Adineta steineri TaxID=433720 RepID=A0A820GFE6_9BILA|nr:unnamed protein product [Adineta steineri]CAF4279154.1 unnamed protein product [Adineta steineri]
MMRSNVWMIDKLEYYLTKDLEATSEEIDYLKRLCTLKTNTRSDPKKRPGARLPSTIIDDFLYHGDLAHARNMNLLNELAIKHIISVCDIQLDKEIIDNFNVLWINIDDTLSVDIRKHFDRTNQFLLSCKEKGEKVLVHCQMGISRSSSIVLAYLIKFHHENLTDAYDHLLNRRHIAAPNFGFFLQLIRYEKALNSDKTDNKDSIPTESPQTLLISPAIASSEQENNEVNS